ncbi:MAG: hypothetical protein JRF63_08815, partial [Deltaproteobacteria bacterium]|nr:hypothetical protein [Deltaproteobacteria bacterium]
SNDSFGPVVHNVALHDSCVTATAQVRFLADGEYSYNIDWWDFDDVSIQ